ncbi:MAG: EamA family transporter [Candidatus Aenigmarchaeota archaeon]|nr:EamA family transporter [Candidatus Aenigmarchaeota archaeon]
MLWFVLSLLASLSKATEGFFSKRGLQKINEYAMAFGLSFFSAIFLSIPLIYYGIPAIDSTFWIAVSITSVLNAIASVLVMKAIKMAPLSLVLPMQNFTPLFLLLTSPIILGEFPGLFGVLGIFLIVIGSYVLNIQVYKKGLLKPFQELFKTKGVLLMLAVALIQSVSANVDKMAIQHSSPFFFGVTANVFIALLVLPFAIKKLVGGEFSLKRMLPVGLFEALTLIFQYHALLLTLVPYVIAVKRTSTIFSSLYGFYFFKEKHIRERLLGVVIMIAGVILILFL